MRKRRRLVSKNKGFTAKRLLLIVLCMAALAGACAGGYFLLRDRDSLGTLAQLPFTADDKYAYTGGGFYYISGDRLCYYDLSDERRNSELQLSSGDVSLVSSGTVTAIYSGAAVQIIGAAELIDAGGQVLSVACGQSHIAVLRTDAAGEAAILVYDASGRAVDAVEPTGDEMLVNCGFSASSGAEQLWTLALDTSGSAPVSVITTYGYGDAGATMSGVITLQSQLVEQVRFAGNSIFLVDTNNLYRYDREITAEAYRVLVYGYTLYGYTTGGSRPLFAFRPRGAETLDCVQLVSVDEAELAGETIRTVQLPAGTHSALAIGGRLMAFTNGTVYVYSASGALQSETALEIPCDEAVKLSETCVLLRRGPEMRLITLR